MDALETARRPYLTAGATARLDRLYARGGVSPGRLAAAQHCPTDNAARRVARGVDVRSSLAPPKGDEPSAYLDGFLRRTRYLLEADHHAMLERTLAQLDALAPDRAASLREDAARSADESPEAKFASLFGGAPTLQGTLADALSAAADDGVLTWDWVNELMTLQLLGHGADSGEPPPRLSPAGHDLVDALGGQLVDLLNGGTADVARDFESALRAEWRRNRDLEGGHAAPLVGNHHLRRVWPDLSACRADHPQVPELQDCGPAGLLWVMCEFEETVYGEVLFVLDASESRVLHLEVVSQED